LPTLLSRQTPKADESTRGMSYAYKASLIGSAYEFELTDAGLSWQAGGKSGVWPYADITGIRLSYRPVTMQSRRYRADVQHKSGQSIAIVSASWQTVALMAPQDRDYRAFVVRLHQRLKDAGNRVVLIAGIGSLVYAAGCLLVALVAIAITGLLARAVATREFAGALFLVGFAALFGWQMGGFIWRNKPRVYTFDSLPETLLP
jgi:hypothetical protein